jgi:hypothetical protein
LAADTALRRFPTRRAPETTGLSVGTSQSPVLVVTFDGQTFSFAFDIADPAQFSARCLGKPSCHGGV